MFETVPTLDCAGRTLRLDRPRICGILNLTDDSFSGDGLRDDIDAAVAQGVAMVEAGADMLDVGAESTRPGATPVSADDEIARVVPVVTALAERVGVPISIDTSKPEVMRAAVAAGAGLINDVCALRREGALDTAAELKVPVCLMHMQGEPGTMQDAPRYDDVAGEVHRFLAERVFACEMAGVGKRSVLVDPGFGFGKTLEHNLALLRALDRFRDPRCTRRVAGRAGGRCACQTRSSTIRFPAVRGRLRRPLRPRGMLYAFQFESASRMSEPRNTTSQSRKYFGTDGVRGRVGEWPITAEFMLKLGRAAGAVLGNGRQPLVLIGKDTHVSGYMFEAALEAGLVAAGANVGLLGPLPTPGVAQLTRELGASAGIVISASHNPYQDNGIKFFSAGGEKLDDAVEAEIEREIDAAFATVAPESLGKARRIDDAIERYARFCLGTLSTPPDLSGVHIVLDCAHGATYMVAPKVFTSLGAKVTRIGSEPDGFNINRGVGSTHPAAL